MNEDIKQRANRCPHMNCAVAHIGQCNCDMAKYCFECKKKSLCETKEVDCKLEFNYKQDEPKTTTRDLISAIPRQD